MKRPLMLILLVLLCCLTVSCQQGERALVEQKVDVEADIQAIGDIVADYNAAVNTADINRFLSYYTEDTVTIPPNEPPIIGKAALLAVNQTFFDEFTAREDCEIKDIQAGGNLAVAHVVYSFIGTPKAGGDASKSKGNWLWIFQKQPDNAWKILYSIFSDESLAYPDRAES
ncbi:MAG: SgcJ/EcaC family oxidoreductase [Acidobacteriota bacterium]|jgi:uncharacterized protein (TIGR02246 family)